MATPNSRKTFKKQKKVNVLKEAHDHNLDIKLDHHQRTTKHVMQAHEIVKLNGPVEPHFWKMWNTPAHVFEIYHRFI